jgi:GT2 family glycosyltransferase
MKASIIVASYRRPEMLKQCLASLLAQSRLPDEVIVVTKVYDPDSTRAVKDVRQSHPQGARIVRVQVNEHPVIVAENAGLARAKGDIVGFIDDDALAHPDWLERMLAHYADPQIGGVGGRDNLYIDGQRYTVGRPEEGVGQLTWYGRISGNHHLGAGGIQQVYFLKGCNMSFRRAAITEIDPRLIGDVTYHWEDDLCLKIRGRGLKLLYDPRIVVDHYGGRSWEERGIEDARYAIVNNHNLVYVLLKHLPLPRKVIFLAYTFLVGDGYAWGVASMLRQVFLRRRPIGFLRALAPSLWGKGRGFVTYLRSSCQRWLAISEPR